MSLKQTIKNVIKWPFTHTPAYRQNQQIINLLETSLGDIHDYNCEIGHMLDQMLTCSLAQARLKDGILTFQYEDMQIKLFIPHSTSDRIQKGILRGNGFGDQPLLEELRPLIEENAIVIDAGANIGSHSVFFSKVCKASKVYSFEPQKSICDIFRENIKLNHIDNIELFPVCLGDSEGCCTISEFVADSLGSTSFKTQSDGDFKMITLDSLNLIRVDFLKIDVEGFQLELLNGAQETLRRCSPVIWVEMLTPNDTLVSYNYEHEVLKPQRLLAELGYFLVKQLSSIDYLYQRKK